MCSGRVDLDFVLRAFSNGMDGVFIGGCRLNECNYITHGNYDALNMVLLCKRILEYIGLNPERLKIAFMSSADGIVFTEVMNKFGNEVRELGPLGEREGIGQDELKSRLAEIRKLVPYIKLVKNKKLASRLENMEEYDSLFTLGEIERLFQPAGKVEKRDAKERVKDWNEVKIGFDAEKAMAEASRCAQCPDPAPCVIACPLDNHIPGALRQIEQGKFVEAANVWRMTSRMPELCSRLCPQEILCEGSCTLSNVGGEPIAIGILERFVTDYQIANEGRPMPNISTSTGKHVVIVGSGPAGMSCAEFLATKGHKITVYDAWPKPGGLIRYGIPAFKIEKHQIDAKIAFLEEIGIEFVCNTKVGEDITIDQILEQGADAVFVSVGAGITAKMNVPGDHLEGIYQSTDYLVRANLALEDLPESHQERPFVGDKVAVIGGGYTATDCIRTSVRLGAETMMYYRRTAAEMPGSEVELQLGLDEGATVQYLCAPTEFHDDNGNGHVDSMTLIHMELGEPDESGRRRPVPIPGSEERIPVTAVVLAIGFWPDPLIGETTPDLETNKWGLIVIDPVTGKTSREGIFAGGDAVTGPDLIVTAAAAGGRAAVAIHEFLTADEKVRSKKER